MVRFPPPRSHDTFCPPSYERLETMTDGFFGESLNGGSQMGAYNHSLQQVHNRMQLCTFVALWALLQRDFSSQNDDTRRQLPIV